MWQTNRKKGGNHACYQINKSKKSLTNGKKLVPGGNLFNPGRELKSIRKHFLPLASVLLRSSTGFSANIVLIRRIHEPKALLASCAPIHFLTTVWLVAEKTYLMGFLEGVAAIAGLDELTKKTA